MGAAGIIGVRALGSPSALAHTPDPEESERKDDHAELARRPLSLQGRPIKEFDAVAFSPDGAFVATVGSFPRFGALVDSASLDGSGRPPRIKTWGHPPVLQLWDAATGREIRTFTGHPAPILSVAFSPDGARIASAGVEKFTPSSESIRKNDKDRVSGVSGFRGRELHAFWNGGLIKIWDTASGRELHTLTGGDDRPIIALGFGRLLTSYAANRVVNLWDPEEGRRLQSLDGLKFKDQLGHHPYSDTDVFSADATRLIFYGLGRGWQWDVRVPRAREIRLLGDAAAPAALMPDGRRFATWSQGRAPRLWDFQTCGLVRDFRPGEGAAVEKEDTVRWPELLKFRPDGTWLAVGTKDGVIRLWDVASGRRLGSVRGPEGPVRALAFLPDGVIRVASDGWNRVDPKSSIMEIHPLLIWEARFKS